MLLDGAVVAGAALLAGFSFKAWRNASRAFARDSASAPWSEAVESAANAVVAETASANAHKKENRLEIRIGAFYGKNPSGAINK